MKCHDITNSLIYPHDENIFLLCFLLVSRPAKLSVNPKYKSVLACGSDKRSRKLPHIRISQYSKRASADVDKVLFTIPQKDTKLKETHPSPVNSFDANQTLWNIQQHSTRVFQWLPFGGSAFAVLMISI